MKITKSQLESIIREELEAVKENYQEYRKEYEALEPHVVELLGVSGAHYVAQALESLWHDVKDGLIQQRGLDEHDVSGIEEVKGELIELANQISADPDASKWVGRLNQILMLMQGVVAEDLNEGRFGGPVINVEKGQEVVHKRDPDKWGLGRVLNVNERDPNAGGAATVTVYWENGQTMRHQPSLVEPANGINEFFGRGEKKQSVPYADSVSFDWSDSGMSMVMSADGKGVLQFSSQKEVKDLISQLEELLQGPMRTSG